MSVGEGKNKSKGKMRGALHSGGKCAAWGEMTIFLWEVCDERGN
jgi:hypothetical protein